MFCVFNSKELYLRPKMKNRITILATITLAGLVAGCELLHYDKEVATVGDKSLMLSELDEVTAGVSGADSVALAENYINQWVRREVKIQEAVSVLAAELADVDRLVEDYRTSLLSSRLEQRYLAGRLDTLITDSMVSAYYDSHRGEFLMDRTILKGRIVRLPDNYRQSVKLYNLMGSKSAEKQQDFLDLCKKNNFELHTFDNWVDFSEFLSYLPVRRDKNYDYILSGGEVRQMADADSKYFIQIDEVLRKGENAPLERVADMVRKILYNRRRVELVGQYNDSLYNAALMEGVIRIENSEK